MTEYKLAEIESKFVELIWENEPIHSGELVKLCSEKLDWKKSTTYTVLRKLCHRGILQNKDTMVTARIKKEEFYSLQSREFVEETFGGSLPKFIAAFTRSKKLTETEIRDLFELINEQDEV
ncbi:BlaI/MecI/CopY family transcriptional regulator [Sinanaerobacter sp. ZZT-01]|uniref:BlaI/MecI/CopY family transcriptional regulator n=1 Tax=Sinanaerobacter sp. ZZT-01 TaxID=3111540 RepID=UPI002D76CB4C|nr:BlaI/MecI/CopY family transcriptional regulator [Sinanaerobacter sp. ZZT-01]WRR92464.1 BlaI/MecI/CopY family transcriptional regulator [Sinanaerobacter sp. ZZT-01]